MLNGADDNRDRDGPVGLDDRVRPASSRERIIKGLKQSAPFSSLQRRIIFFNLIGLALLVAGMTYLSNDRQILAELYVAELQKQGRIIAIGVAEAASSEEPGGASIDQEKAGDVLAKLVRPLVDPAKVRIRLYNKDAKLIAGNIDAGTEHKEPEETLPKSDKSETGLNFFQRIERLYERVSHYLSESPQIHGTHTGGGIIAVQDVLSKHAGDFANFQVNEQKDIIFSVWKPVVKSGSIVGVLHLSTIGGAIENLVRKERRAIVEIFFLAAIVSVLSSIVLANMIASPIRQLAKAANVEGGGTGLQIGADKPEIPDLTHRSDEIGELSEALIRMTGALYQRIDAIESFAADVAHEIKNPLTSLRSAVETMQYAKTDEQRQRLLDVIVNDVKRMDRLVTDISNASRLDAELVRERMDAFDMGELIGMLAEVTENEGSDRGVKVVTDLPSSAFVARGLEGRLAQVITNLLGNAMSFSPENSTIRVTGRTRSNGAIRVSVQDEGPGIPPENLDSIFERFYSERPETEAFGNHSGLGLSISRQIVEAHGGQIWAENIGDPGSGRTGARFVMELPA